MEVQDAETGNPSYWMKETKSLYGTQYENATEKQLQNTQEVLCIKHCWISLCFSFLFHNWIYKKKLCSILFPIMATFYLLLNTLYCEQYAMFPYWAVSHFLIYKSPKMLRCQQSGSISYFYGMGKIVFLCVSGICLLPTLLANEFIYEVI